MESSYCCYLYVQNICVYIKDLMEEESIIEEDLNGTMFEESRT